MIKAEQIPDEVVKEALSAYNYASTDCYTTEEQDIAIAIAAALNAWPGAEVVGWYHADHTLILPLPTEARNER
jgi:hypothetical protein